MGIYFQINRVARTNTLFPQSGVAPNGAQDGASAAPAAPAAPSAGASGGGDPAADGTPGAPNPVVYFDITPVLLRCFLWRLRFFRRAPPSDRAAPTPSHASFLVD